MIDDEIIRIRDEHLPNQGEPFDTLAFGRAVALAERERCAHKADASAATAHTMGNAEEFSELAASIRAGANAQFSRADECWKTR